MGSVVRERGDAPVSQGFQFKGKTDREVSLYVGHLPGRKSGTVAVQRGSVIKVLAYCRSDADMAELQQVLAELWGVDLPEPEEASDVG